MKILRNRKTLIIVITIVILILIALIIYFLSNGEEKDLRNSYNYDDGVVELPNTTTYKNSNLDSEHCLNGICIDDAVFYYNDNEGRVEYTITNTTSKTKSGYLKMVFKDHTLIIAYSKLKPKKTIKSRSQYSGVEIKDKSDYKLKKLSKEELSKIKK